MVNVRTSYEAARGCGYRKPGGLYLVAGGLTRPCGKLPIPLHVCPTCGGGVKATRGWQWIMPRLLFSGIECRDKDHVVAAPAALAGLPACRGCLCGDEMPERGGLLWVGGKFYGKPEDFMREARVQGVSRRIATVPKGFVPGETVVYLGHREAVPLPCTCERTHCAKGHTVEDHENMGWTCDLRVSAGPWEHPEGHRVPGVFTAFIPRAIEYVVKGDESEEELERLEKRGLELVDVKRQQGEFEFEESDE